MRGEECEKKRKGEGGWKQLGRGERVPLLTI